MDLLEERGASVLFHDPLVPEILPTREYPHLAGRRSVPLDVEIVEASSGVLIVTDYEGVDYRLIVSHARIVFDTRNARAHAGIMSENVVKC